MYEKFFGFQRPPFELVPDPDFLFLGESHDSALANLVIGIDSGKGFIAISGEVGTGKTTILRALLRRLGRDQNICFLSQPELDVTDLLHAILNGFGIAPQGADRVILRQQMRDTLVAADKPGILIVDEAHLLSEEALEQIRLLSNLEEEHRKLLQIVLSGQLELNELLSRPRLRPLTQRIEMFYQIEALTLEETHAYIDRRIRVAGNPDGLIFEAGAVARIHEYTGGIPRLINVLSDRSLITAYVDESRTISAKLVHAAYEDLGRVTQSVMPGGGQTAESYHPPRTYAAEPHTVAAVAPPPPLPPPVPLPQAAPATMSAPVATQPMQPSPAAPAVPMAAPTQPPAAEFTFGDPPARVRRPRAFFEKADRWVALGGIAALAILAALSLGSWNIPFLSSTPTKAGAPFTGGVEASSTRQPGAAELGGEGPYAIHVASFQDLEQARGFSRSLRETTGEATRIAPTEAETGLWYRVLLGEYASRDSAIDRMGQLRTTHDFFFMKPVRLVHPEEQGRTPIDSQ